MGTARRSSRRRGRLLFGSSMVVLGLALPAPAGAATPPGAAAGTTTSAATAPAATAPAATAPAATSTVQAFMTLYGYADNSPPGTDIAHPCGRRSGAGGTGTYADPITFATDVKELPWCEVIYVPYMERYFIHEDECSECDRDWRRYGLYRFDMWAGGDAASRHDPEKKALHRCESTWTRADSVKDPTNPTVTLDPPNDLPVTTAAIFSPPTTCWDGSQ